jgi:hypothetical protein
MAPDMLTPLLSLFFVSQSLFNQKILYLMTTLIFASAVLLSLIQ